MSEIEDFFLNELKYENKHFELLRHGSGHRKDEIWRKCNKNERVPKKYKINNLSELLFFYDDSLWRNAKSGMLITSKALFVYPYHDIYSDNPINYALWDMIGSYNCDHRSGFLTNTMYLTFFDYRGNALFSSEHTVGEDEFQFVNSLLRKLFNYRQEKKKLEAEAKRKAELAKKKKLEVEAKRKAELEKKKKLEAEEKRKAELEKKKKLEAEKKRKAELEKKKKLEAEKKRKAELEKKKKLEAEEKRKAELEKKKEQLRIEKNSYYYEIEINNRKVIKGPFSREDMISLLEKNEISLLTNVKFGLHKKTFKKLKSFPEFTSGFEDFL